MEVTIWFTGSNNSPDISQHCLFGFTEYEYSKVKEFDEIKLNEYNQINLSCRKYTYVISIDNNKEEFDNAILLFLNKITTKLTKFKL